MSSAVTHGGEPGVDELLELVIADPPRAAAAASSRLATGERLTAREVARLHWVLGHAEREAGRLDSAKAHLEDALGIAGTIGDVEALIGIHSSLAFTVARQGDLDGALKLIELAELMAGPVERARLLAQRGTVLYLRGELSGGAELVAAACEEMKRTGDTVHEARHRTNLGMALSDLGRYGAARRHLSRAVALAEQHGLDILVAHAKASLAYTSTLQGDLPAALREFAEAEHWHRKVDPTMDMPRLQTDHARALADAALLDDAEGMLANALAVLRAQGQYTELPACLLRAAEIGVARGNLVGAVEAADEATRLFAQQGRDRWVALAANLALRARVRLEGASPATVAELDRGCEQLDEYGWHAEALRTRLLVAMLHAESDTLPPRPLRPEVREGVRRGRAVDRILMAYVDALTAVRRDDRGAARRAITNGLRVAVHAQAGMGAMETRAHAARYGYDLTELGARLAIADGRAMELLGRIEATRLMTSRMPMLRPPEDDAMAAMLTELRSLGVRIAAVDTPTHERIEAENQRIRLERRVRRHARGARGDQTVVAGFETELREARRHARRAPAARPRRARRPVVRGVDQRWAGATARPRRRVGGRRAHRQPGVRPPSPQPHAGIELVAGVGRRAPQRRRHRAGRLGRAGRDRRRRRPARHRAHRGAPRRAVGGAADARRPHRVGQPVGHRLGQGGAGERIAPVDPRRRAHRRSRRRTGTRPRRGRGGGAQSGSTRRPRP